jgi:ribosomal protein S18 acetylase RimI-like enzyme
MLRLATPLDAPGIARVHVVTWRATYTGLLPNRYLAAMDVDDYAARWQRALRTPVGQAVVLVIEEAGEVVGFASAGPERDGDRRYEGELYAIYLLPDCQGRGLGRSLVRAAASDLSSRAITSMAVWVLRENHAARAFYERLGGVYLRERALDLGTDWELDVPEVAYLWSDVRASILA